VKVKPGSSKNQLTVLEDGSWVINLRAKPIDGEANIELVKFLSEKLNISKSKIVIEKGLNARYKTLSIDDEGMTKT
jgi:uncharacterized protein (TIGR00251 family)